MRDWTKDPPFSTAKTSRSALQNLSNKARQGQLMATICGWKFFAHDERLDKVRQKIRPGLRANPVHQIAKGQGQSGYGDANGVFGLGNTKLPPV